jgi:hypothetical protein
MSIRPVPAVPRGPVEPVPVGTVVLMAFRITGYDRDCDGSAMARLENIDALGEATGWEEAHVGLYPESAWVADSIGELGKVVGPRSESNGGNHEGGHRASTW